MATQENATTTSTTSTVETPKPEASAPKNDPINGEDRFKFGVIIRGKFIGVEDVKEDHGDELCRTSMIKLKALAVAKKEHKQRICVKISLDGVEILDERTNTPMFNHAVTKISYIARDIEDSRAIGYIYKNSPNSYQYFAIKTIGQAQELFNTLKELFEVVLAIRQRAKAAKKAAEEAAKKEQEENEAKASVQPAVTTTTPDEHKDQEIIGLEGTIKQMNEQPPSLLDINSDPNNLVSSFEDTLTLASPAPVAAAPATTENKNATNENRASDELFSLMDPGTSAPSPQENAFNALKNQIASIQTYSMPPPRIAPPTPNMMPNPFGASMMTPPPMQNAANPFGQNMSMGAPMQQPSQMQPGQMQPGQMQPGFISPNPNMFSSQIPNPTITFNSNTATNQQVNW